MKTVFRILLASFLLQTATTNGEILLSTLNNRQNSPPLYAPIGNLFGEYLIGGFVVQTGKNPDGYTLNSVTLTMDDASGSPINFYVSLSELPTPNHRLIHLTGSRTPRRAGRYTYRPESRYFLKPNTTYNFAAWAPFNARNNHFALLGTRADERVRSSDGWRINATAAYRIISGDVELISKGGVPLIAIDATKISPPKPTPPPLSGDATLRSLALSGVPINFASNINQYSASVSHPTASTTVTAFPNESNARVSIAPADADANTAGHQVRLVEGNNSIVITVTAPNGNSRAYTIAVRRALPTPTPPTPTPQPEPKPSLSIRKTGNLIEIRWSGGTLQHSPAIAGPWKDVHVSSPLRLDRSWWRPSEFFRVR